MEVVPLFGDMMVSPFNLVQGMPNFDDSKWSHCMEMLAGEGKVDIPAARNNIKRQHDLLVCQLGVNDTKRQQLTPKIKVGTQKFLSNGWFCFNYYDTIIE